MSRTTIVYHDNCHDGITALWVALQAHPNADPYPGRYDEEPVLESFEDRDVIFVDFSWKRPTMMAVGRVANTILVLDHHKTAEFELAALQVDTECPTRVVFDMERSGAGLAWDELVGGPAPSLVDYVEDRDLWRFALPKSREVHAACNSYPLTLEARSILMRRAVLGLTGLAQEGTGILRYHDKLVASAAECARREVIAGVDVPSVACPNVELVSDLGHLLAENEPFAAVWREKPDGTRLYSLRSRESGLDVGEIAKSLGGGGHKHAAGFVRLPPMKRRVIIESPYAGDVERNLGYLRAAMRDALFRDEAPFASHGLYTQPGVLDDDHPGERSLGMEAGFRWTADADLVAVYTDLGVSDGMRAGIERAVSLGIPVVERSIEGCF